MTKAKRMMQEDIKLVDLCLELVDARIPFSSRNPDIDELAKGKARLIILNKSDLSDPKSNELWVDFYRQKGFETLLLDSRNRSRFKDVNKAIDSACAKKKARDQKKGIINRPVRAMVVGIPNVGKSTFINSIANKACTKTGNKPGVTKGKQWVRLNKSVELLDTPGILWPKFEDEKTGMNLAFIGSINDDILDENELAFSLIEFLKDKYPQIIENRYNVEEKDDTLVILDNIARSRGCLKKCNETDVLKASRIVLDEFRSGKLGKITLEEPQE